MTFQMTNCEQVLLQECNIPQITRKDIALTYRLAMQSQESVDWTKVNAAIIERWSKSGLKYIKELAWKGEF